MSDMNDIAVDFQSILKWKPESVFELTLPTTLGTHVSIRLKRLIYRALYFLKITRQRSVEDISLALEDIFKIYRWFYQKEADQVKATLAELERVDPALVANIQAEQYEQEALEAVKMHYLGHFDALKEAATQSDRFLSELELPNKLESDHFTNAEFFCVLALFKASVALENLQELESSGYADDGTYWEIERVINPVLEALSALDLADLYDQLISVTLQDTVDEVISYQQRQRSLQGNTVQWAKHKTRREKAWQLYKSVKKAQPDLKKVNLIAHIVDEVQQVSDELGIERLTVGSEVETISKWFNRYYGDEYKAPHKKKPNQPKTSK